MTTSRLLSAVAAAGLAFAAPAMAAEEDIFTHYEAYESAMTQLRYDVAEQEAEAAWRAAEAEWGGIEDTAVLAFNLVRVRLMGDRRAEAVEPAQRLAELVASGAAGQSVSPKEAAVFSALAEFDAMSPDRAGTRALQDALNGYAPTDFATKRIALLGWSYLANAYFATENWRGAYNATQSAEAIALEDATAPTLIRSTVASIAARAAYETDNIEEGLTSVLRGIAAFPPQPAGAQPIDPMLTQLLIWKEALTGLYAGPTGRQFTPPDPALSSPAWDDERYATRHGCTLVWADAPVDPPRPGRPAPSGIGAAFEFSLNPDGSVASVAQVHQTPGDEEHPFAETLRRWRAEPPGRAECQGPHIHVVGFLFPRG